MPARLRMDRCCDWPARSFFSVMCPPNRPSMRIFQGGGGERPVSGASARDEVMKQIIRKSYIEIFQPKLPAIATRKLGRRLAWRFGSTLAANSGNPRKPLQILGFTRGSQANPDLRKRGLAAVKKPAETIAKYLSRIRFVFDRFLCNRSYRQRRAGLRQIDARRCNRRSTTPMRRRWGGNKSGRGGGVKALGDSAGGIGHQSGNRYSFRGKA